VRGGVSICPCLSVSVYVSVRLCVCVYMNTIESPSPSHPSGLAVRLLSLAGKQRVHHTLSISAMTRRGILHRRC
jgi:hypothetical protein